MKKYLCALVTVVTITTGFAQTWPILKKYDQDHIARIAMPVGGIGTGTISLGGNGQWKDVEIMNRPAKGFYGSTTSKQAPCFMIFTSAGEKKISKALMGPISIAEYPGAEGSFAPNHGLPRFAQATFSSAYPFGQVALSDDDMPVQVTASAFNPLIPGDPDASGIPIAIIRYEIVNKTDQPVTVAVAGSLDNFIGIDGSDFTLSGFNKSQIFHGANDNRNEFRKTANLAGIYMLSDSVDKSRDTWGTLALVTSEKEGAITYRKEFSPKGWNANITDMWDDFSDDGAFRDESFKEKSNTPRAALSVKFDLPARGTRTIQFLLTWHFPNRKDWFNEKNEILGNYYTNT
jgi:non-lysosomal glucosylceramidase